MKDPRITTTESAWVREKKYGFPSPATYKPLTAWKE